ncbi:MAG: glycoside hydrolase family 99-like domain-containing protein [Actinomycetes bacterium]
MTALGESRHDAAVGLPSEDAFIREVIEEAARIQQENLRLRQRVDDLELTVQEYRTQVSHVLGSASWKVTSPIRATASRYRLAKVRARRALRRARRRSATQRQVLTAGLFPPPITDLPEGSPLRRPVDPSSLRRPLGADGPASRPEGSPRIVVVAHVHYPELWGDIEDRLARLPEAFDLIVTVTEGSAELAVSRIRARHPHAVIEVVSNRGRDWAPLVHVANKGLLAGYDAVAKVHTKKSEHRIDGDGWRIELLDGVLESPDQIARIVALLREDRSVGLVVPTGHVSGTEHWGSDQGIVEMLASRLPLAFDPNELRFPAGAMFWCRPWLIDRLADLDITDSDFEPEAGQYDGTTAHALERLVGIYTSVAGMDIVEAMDVKARLAALRKSHAVRPRVFAFYLPQYHAVPENDLFWGEGFTDWVNVKRATPMFDGHRQPLEPSDALGYYDLIDPAVLKSQAALAREHGIDGFVFHHYWFDGHKVLDAPVNSWLADPSIDMPLALCWANEPWSRRWDGQPDDVLIPQTYGDGWATRFWDDISRALADPRYIRVDGKPMLVVYRIGEIPDAVDAIRIWRERARAAGHEDLFIAAVRPAREVAALSADVVNAVDALISFPPGGDISIQSIMSTVPKPCGVSGGDVMSYASAFDEDLPVAGPGQPPILPGVMPGWDNTARRGADAYLFMGANPVSFAGALRRRLPSSRIPAAESMIFINAWNEWAEGAVIEPSARFGDANLASVADVLPGAGKSQ